MKVNRQFSVGQIQIRIDDKTKKDAQKILDDLGLDLSSAIKVYLKQIIIHKGVPLRIVIRNGLTIRKEKEIQRAAAEAKKGKNVSKEMEIKEAVKYLNSL